ncbi:nicotinate-nucleotide adenylyltransferase [Persephonella sp.]|uniref:nicotinate-nucleotide adenylyltransferase n=1 Tax=Persephonella sp. TaxID=2060922 RepID=UPI0025ED5E98|nr:nicotinate-nucleotide adenylyltransferase [Persephonella sp.]
MMMVGIYGGSFDPVHIGHLRIAEDVREYYNLPKIIFIPAYHSPLKPESRASAEDRLQMIKISIKNNPFFSIDDIEIKRKGKSFTIDTVKVYREKGLLPVFIVGTDAFLTLHRWKNSEELSRLTSFIVLGRGKDSYDDVKNYLKENFPYMDLRIDNSISKNEGAVYYFDRRRIDVSSTEIRERVKTNRSIKYLVLPEVEEYIFNKKLYRG